MVPFLLGGGRREYPDTLHRQGGTTFYRVLGVRGVGDWVGLGQKRQQVSIPETPKGSVV